MLYILLIIFLLLVNFIFFRIYSYSDRKKFLNKVRLQQHNLNGVTTKKKNSILRTIFYYMAGWIRFSLRATGYIPSHRIRKFIYKHAFLMNIGKNVIIYGGAEIRAPWNITIGDGSIIGDESKLDGRNEIIIGKNVNFSTGVWLWTDQHKVNSIKFESLEPSAGKIIIEDRAWLGPRTMVLPGKTIGEGAVIGGGSCD